jgi:IS5 family transposase
MVNHRLLENPKILDTVHGDLKKMRAPSGKTSNYSSDMILRMFIVKFMEMLSWRDTIVRVENDMVLRNFVGVGFSGKFPNHSYLCVAFKFIRPETWNKVNELLKQDAITKEEITGEKLRADTTLYETNIHFPTDSHLLWDSFRLLTRLIRNFRELYPHMHFGYRFHNKKVKKHYTFISRNSGAKTKSVKRHIKKRYGELIGQVHRACEAAESCIAMMWNNSQDIAPIDEMKHYLPIVRRVLHQAEKRINEGIILPPNEKVYSIFEEHTELIKRGKAGKDVEFGHMVMLAQTGEKFISDYEVMRVKKSDNDLVDPILENHKKAFGTYPDKFAADKGFHESTEKTEKLEEDIGLACIPKKGRRTLLQLLKEHSPDFLAMQRFRAGAEGSISALKRAFGMERCLLRTFNTFAASMGCIVFCYNLTLLSTM